ncbi:anaphase promoting complex subunit doc1 [Xylographa trunciseda]|nr:anaphase promoting complex subunit doc1 [Xylographa trunciseda]
MVERTGQRVTHTLAVPDAMEDDASSQDSATDEEEAALSSSPPASFTHLREISPLASWTVSTSKPGCGVPALLSPSTTSFWQSDGPQPHLLNIHFFKLVAIVKLRVYLDFELDESYTPTKMSFAAGMGEYDLVEFGEWKGEQPKGWVEVGLEGCGGVEADEEGVLRCMCLQIRVLENHQNGKDTHLRGVQIFSRDERVRVPRGKGDNGRVEVGEDGYAGLDEPDWMREPELR